METLDDTDLRGLAKLSQTLQDTNPTLKESSVGLRLVQPLLGLLGWDLSTGDIDPEFAVKVGSKQVYVDYALLIERDPIVFVEIKGFDSALEDDEISQVLSYGRLGGVKWCMITNGREIVLLNSEWGKSPQDCLVARFEFPAIVEQKKNLMLFSKGSVVSQDSERLTEAVRENRQVVQNLQRKRDALVADLASILVRHGGGSVSRRSPNLASMAVDQMLSVLETELSPTAVSSEPPQTVIDPSSKHDGESLAGMVRGYLTGHPKAEFPEVLEVARSWYLKNRGPLPKTFRGVVWWAVQRARGIRKGVRLPKTFSFPELPRMRRAEYARFGEDVVLVCPSKPDGAWFFFKYAAWGFIRVNSNPKFLALYLGSPMGKVMYVGEVESITPPLTARDQLSWIDDSDVDTFTPGKKAVRLKRESLRELETPIPVGRAGSQPQSPRFTTARKLATAKTTADLW